MEDIKVGEYIRRKCGEIFIATEVNPTLGKEIAIVKNEHGYPRRIDLTEEKHSFNLIDLIENNDIVLIKTKGTQFVNLGIVRKREDQRSGKLNILVNGQNTNEFEILEVLTHEQYDANSYKVE